MKNVFFKIIFPSSSFSVTKCTVHPDLISLSFNTFSKVFNPLNFGKKVMDEYLKNRFSKRTYKSFR